MHIEASETTVRNLRNWARKHKKKRDLEKQTSKESSMSIWREVSAWDSPFWVRTEKSELPWIRPSSFQVLWPCLTSTTLLAALIPGNPGGASGIELNPLDFSTGFSFSISCTLAEDDRTLKRLFFRWGVWLINVEIQLGFGGATENICNCECGGAFRFWFWCVCGGCKCSLFWR